MYDKVINGLIIFGTVYDTEHGSFHVSYRNELVSRNADNTVTYQKVELRCQRLACDGTKKQPHATAYFYGPWFAWGREELPKWPPCPRCGATE